MHVHNELKLGRIQTLMYWHVILKVEPQDAVIETQIQEFSVVMRFRGKNTGWLVVFSYNWEENKN